VDSSASVGLAELITAVRGVSRIFGRKGGLIQGTNLYVLQHAKHAELGGSGGIPTQNFLKIYAEILQFRYIST